MIDRHRKTWMVVLGGLIFSLRVFGQPSAEAERQSLLEQAQNAADAGDHDRALALAARAGQIRMTPSLRLFIAEEQSAFGQFANSLNNAELCVREATDDKKLRNRQRIISACNSLIAKLQKSAARLLVLMPDPVPPQAQVMVNGHVLPESFYGKPYLLSAGNVRVEASAPDRLPFQRELAIAAGEQGTVTVELNPLAPPQVVQPEPARRREGPVATATTQAPSKGSIGPYIVLGAGAASAGAAVLFLLLRNSAVSDLEKLCSGPDNTVCQDTPQAHSFKDKASTNNLLTNVAMGVAGAAVVGGATWLIIDKLQSSGSSPRAHLQVTPTPGGAVVGIAGAL